MSRKIIGAAIGAGVGLVIVGAIIGIGHALGYRIGGTFILAPLFFALAGWRM